MGKYVEQAVKSFLEDNKIEYDGLEFKSDCIFFKRLSGNITCSQMRDFEEEFRVVFLCYSWEDDFMVNVELTYREDA